MSCLMHFQLSLKQQKQFSICHRARLLVQTQYLSGRSASVRETYRVVSLHVEEGCYSTRIQGCIYNPHRCISLWSIAGKILAKIILNRLNEHLDQAGLLPESQCGFRKDRRTIDMSFTARHLQEKCQEQNVDPYTTLVDLTKAFDTKSVVMGSGQLWQSGCPARFIAMVRQSHDGMLARVQNDGKYSETFPVTNGVKQGCVLAPTLFRCFSRL